jgi:hypothetical protein
MKFEDKFIRAFTLNYELNESSRRQNSVHLYSGGAGFVSLTVLS